MLGEDFLEQFDMLIDNAHSVLCLDNAGAMQAEVEGHDAIPLEVHAYGLGARFEVSPRQLFLVGDEVLAWIGESRY